MSNEKNSNTSGITLAHALGGRAQALRALERAKAAYATARTKVVEATARYKDLNGQVKQLEAANKPTKPKKEVKKPVKAPKKK